MVQFVQSIIKPTPTVNIATTESEESGEPQNQKLTDYNKRINEQLENHSILPSGLSEKDAVLVSKIAQEVQEQYPNLAKADQDKKVAQSYFLVKECQEHPEKAPPMQLAAAAVAIPIIDFAGWLIGVIVAYKAAEDAPKIARILLDSEESEEYNELDKFEKKRHGGKNNPLPTPKLADFGAPNIDPDDFEPEEEGENDAKEFKTSNFERGNNVGLHRFTERFEKTKFRDPKTKQYIEKDHAFNSGSGPHDGAYKLFDQSGKRIGTVTKEGKWLRQ
jgi:hypothetical protein